MDNDQQQITDLKKEALKKASSFEEIMATPGFEAIKGHIQEQMTVFINKSLLDGFKSMEDYQYARGYVNGLRELLGDVQSSLDELHRYRESVRSEREQPDTISTSEVNTN